MLRDLKVGKLLFKVKAIQLIALAFFLDGVVLGGFIASSALGGNTINVFFLMIALFAVWLPLFSTIARNVEELSR